MHHTISIRAVSSLVLFVTALLSVPFLAPMHTLACSEDIAGKSEEQLQEDLELCNEEIKKWQAVLQEAEGRVSSIDSDVQALNAKIKAAESNIKAKNIAISQIGDDITERTEKIGELETLIEEGRASLAQLIRRTHEVDDYSLVEVVLDSRNLSEFFVDLDSFSAIQEGLKERFELLRQNIVENNEERDLLSEAQDKERDARYVIETQKKQISQDEQEKQRLLAITKQEAQSYEQIVADRQAKRNQINAALFRLRGIDGGGIPFQEALAYANAASDYTGVRTAFILGILRQESNLGVNVGQCLLSNAQTGAGIGKNTGTPFANVMKPDRDVPYFLDLMDRLGRDPYGTPVSCPLSIGYGGAMGPTQFIPSTWRGYEGRIANAFGEAVGDPWNPEHAIMATALFLQDLGASRGGYSAEREAAARYYAGGNWQAYGLGYAASVLTHAENYQADIDFLED